MADKILGPLGSTRRRRFLWVPMLLVACTALFLVAGAQAVHNTKFFQLDGDAAAGTVPTGVTSNGVEDWDTICAAHLQSPNVDNQPGPFCHPAPGQTLPSGGTLSDRSAFITDAFLASTDNIYKGGTDDSDLPTWSWKEAGPSPNKADIEQAFAAQYTCTAALQSAGKCSAGSDFLGHKYLYFGGTRFANNGDTNIGLWFFHNRVTVAGANTTSDSTGIRCEPSSGCGFGSTDTAGSAAPVHTAGNCSLPGHPVPCTPGDLFVQSAFTSKPSIKVFEWVGAGNATKDYNGTNGCITSACTLQPVQFVQPAGATDNRCETTATTTVDQGCAIVNDQGEIQSPWLFQDQSSKSPANKIEASELFEGGLDLTALGFGEQCISTVLLNTRSSGSSVNSVAQDFALGQFGGCIPSVVTTPSITGAEIPASGTLSVTDTAAVDVQGVSTWAGTVSFHLCGPADLTSQANCSTGGTSITPDKSVSNASKSATSAAATITSAGKYCWRADVHFTTPATGIDDVHDPSNSTSQSECFTITPKQPTLTTQASGPVTLGNPISDTATLLGTANQPGTPVINPTTAGGPAGGTITWTVFGPDNCTTVAFGPVTRDVSGDGTYPTAAQPPVSFTPTAIGVYTFVASYSGNLPNTKSVPATGCPDTTGTETVTVTGNAHITTAQDWLPNDTATLTGDANLNGTLTFTLYHSADCTGTAVSGQTYTITVTNADKAGADFSTSNTTFKVKAANAGDYSWLVHYHDNTLSSPADRCEHSNVAITD